MSASGGVVRTMKLTFDYKIKFSEKVYTYILQKKGLRVHLPNEDQLPTTLIQLTRACRSRDKSGERHQPPLCEGKLALPRVHTFPSPTPTLHRGRKPKDKSLGVAGVWGVGGNQIYTTLCTALTPGRSRRPAAPSLCSGPGEGFCFGGDTKTRPKASLSAACGTCGYGEGGALAQEGRL